MGLVGEDRSGRCRVVVRGGGGGGGITGITAW